MKSKERKNGLKSAQHGGCLRDRGARKNGKGATAGKNAPSKVKENGSRETTGGGRTGKMENPVLNQWESGG